MEVRNCRWGGEGEILSEILPYDISVCEGSGVWDGDIWDLGIGGERAWEREWLSMRWVEFGMGLVE